MTRFRNCGRVGAAVVAVGLLGAAAAGQPVSPEHAAVKQKLAEDKVGRDVAEALSEADKRARDNRRAQAADILKKAKQDLQFAPTHQ